MEIRTTLRAVALGTALSLPMGFAIAQDVPADVPPATMPESPTVPGATPEPPAAAPAAAATEQDMDQKLAALFGDSAPYKAFLADLKTKAADGKAAELAKTVSYPFKTKIDGEEVTIDNERDMARQSEKIFTPGVLAAIEAQTYETLFANQMGAMIGSGEVWFSMTGEGADQAVKIIAINQMPTAS